MKGESFMSHFTIFQGNCPKNVNKTAKYSIRLMNNKPTVTIVYDTKEGERWYPSTDEHPLLVKMVNDAKNEISGRPNGVFYINEYNQVIVPANDGLNYYLIGEYYEEIEFKFEGKIISGKPVDFDNNLLKPGDEWVGPHVGIPYILSANNKDIYYVKQLKPSIEKKVRLSQFVDKKRIEEVISMIKKIKGEFGGRFYVNEYKTLFTPVQENDSGFIYKYIGQLDLNNWFPKIS